MRISVAEGESRSRIGVPAAPGSRREWQRIREHRPGRVAKTDADPELRVFILEGIDTMTFLALTKAVADAFLPPDRRVGTTAINDWWRRHLAPDARRSEG